MVYHIICLNKLVQVMKFALRVKAIELRQTGLSYSEILKKVPVAKSTLSLWLRSVGLSKRQKQRLTEKRLKAAKRGAQQRREQRLLTTAHISKEAHNEIETITKKNLWLMGIMLYWAEGSKSKVYHPSQGVIFSNSDSLMVNIFLKWLTECLEISLEKLVFDIYIHETHRNRINGVKEYWSKRTGFPVTKFDRIYYKAHKVKTNRKNIGANYHGLLRIKVRESTNLNRKIAAWIEAICEQCGVV